MAFILEKQERRDEAIDLLKKAIVQTNDHPPQLYLVLSSLYEIKGGFDDAIEILEEGIQYHERNVEYGTISSKYPYQNALNLIRKVCGNLFLEIEFF